MTTASPGDTAVAQQTSYLPPLDGVRGLSAVMVVLTHAGKFGLPHFVSTAVDVALGSYAVMVFFTLSGFLMGHLYLNKRCDIAAGSNYIAARTARIVPLYYAIVIVSWFVYNYYDSSFWYPMTNGAVVRHLLFFGSAANFWSIGPEVQFYAFFILFWWAVDRLRNNDSQPLIIFLIVVCIIFAFQPLFPGVTVFSKMHIFMVGIGLAVLHQRLDTTLSNGRLILALQLALIGFGIMLWLIPDTGAWLITTERRDIRLNIYYGDARRVMVGALIVFAFSFETRFAHAILANGLARRLGAYSYSIYLLHGPTLWALERSGVFARTGPTFGYIVALCAVYLVSWLSFALIEMPSQRLLRKPLAHRLKTMFKPVEREFAG
jgi:peptidoglycan/LPS O-acetylase OafA/YrhL